MQQNRFSMSDREEAQIRQEVLDAQNATEEERMEAALALLELTYDLWARELGTTESLCRFPSLTQERRPGRSSSHKGQ